MTPVARLKASGLALWILVASSGTAVAVIIPVDVPAGYTLKKCKTEAGIESCGPVNPAPGVVVTAAPAAPVALAVNSPADSPAVPAPAASAPIIATVSPVAKVDAFQQVSNYAEVDQSVPSSVAESILGISTSSAQRPGTIQDFAGSLVRGLGQDGKQTNAIAIDISPATVFFKSSIRGGDTYAPVEGNDFSSGWGTRVLARTTVSLGSTAADSNGATRSAWGVRVGLLDWGDPGLYARETSKCVQSLDHPPIPAGKGLDPTVFDLSSCDPNKNQALSLWAKPALYVAYGQSWYSQSGSLTDHAPDVKQFWMTYSQGLSGQSMPGTSRIENKTALASSLRVLGQLSFGRRMDDRTPDPNNASALLSQNSTQLIGRLRAGMSNWHTFAELGRSHVTLGNSTTENLRHTAFGAEAKVGFLGDDSWVQLATVREQGYSDGKDHTGITLNFRIGSPALALPGPVATTAANK